MSACCRPSVWWSFTYYYTINYIIFNKSIMSVLFSKSRVYIHRKIKKIYHYCCHIQIWSRYPICWFRCTGISAAMHVSCRLRIWFVHSNHQKEKIYHKKERKRKRVDLKGDAILKTSQNYLEVSDDTGIIEFLVMHAFADKLN